MYGAATFDLQLSMRNSACGIVGYCREVQEIARKLHFALLRKFHRGLRMDSVLQAFVFTLRMAPFPNVDQVRVELVGTERNVWEQTMQRVDDWIEVDLFHSISFSFLVLSLSLLTIGPSGRRKKKKERNERFPKNGLTVMGFRRLLLLPLCSRFLHLCLGQFIPALKPPGNDGWPKQTKEKKKGGRGCPTV